MKHGEVISHWSLLVEGLQTSVLEFYNSLEASLTAREVPDIEFSRVEWAEGGVASAKRQYLRVRRGKLVFDICAAPYGRGFFFSWWLARTRERFRALWGFGLFLATLMFIRIAWGASRSIFDFFLMLIVMPFTVWVLLAILGSDPAMENSILETPYVGWIYRKLFNPHTYYKFDTALMFQESVRKAVNEAIADLRSAQGLRTLSDAELKPRVRDLAEL